MNLKCVDSTEPGWVAERLAQIIAAVVVAVADELSLSALAIVHLVCAYLARKFVHQPHRGSQDVLL